MASGKRGLMSLGDNKGDIELECDVGLGLKMQHFQQQHNRKMMMLGANTPTPTWPLHTCSEPLTVANCDNSSNDGPHTTTTTPHSRSPSPNICALSDTTSNGPFFPNFIYDVTVAAAPSQSHHTPLLSRFGGGGTTTSPRDEIAFTAIQRQELERQTVIYKYMMASLPVPPELLIPLSSEVGRRGSKNAGLELRYTTNSNSRGGGGGGGGGDPEPWRCRRTDGKKWRCSRDVAPDQKYCERHSHKGRPSRSRKPVESSLLSPNTTVTTNTNACTPTPNTSNPIPLRPPASSSSSSSFDFSSPLFHYNQQLSTSRYPAGWFMKREAVGAPLCSAPMGGGGEARGNVDVDRDAADFSQSCLLPRPFIDAWSMRDVDKDAATSISTNCAASSPAHSVLPLSLSMSAGIDDDHEHSEDSSRNHQIHDGDQVQGQGGIRVCTHHQQQPLNWMTSWIGSPPGGPLAEALGLGMPASSGTPNASDELLSPHGRSTSSSTTTTTGSRTFTC